MAEPFEVKGWMLRIAFQQGIVLVRKRTDFLGAPYSVQKREDA